MSPEPTARAAAAAAELRTLGEEIARARKALDALGPAWTAAAQRERCLETLRRAARLRLPDLGALAAELTAAARTFVEAQRAGFLDEMHAACEQAGHALVRVGDRPPVFVLEGLTLTVDFDNERCDLSYARERLVRLPLSVPEVLDARSTLLARFASLWPGAATFHDACRAAYRARLGRRGGEPGERVDLVDLLPELAVEFAERKIAVPAAPGERKAGSLSRADLAWCLDRLAAEGALSSCGFRLELGTATGGSTKHKERVLFLESGVGGGQYYLSLRFVPDRLAGA